jgi:hypothetical protein
MMDSRRTAHILLTRYNIDTSLARKKGVDPLSESFLRPRGELFRQFCVPSVKAQISKDFEWFVLFDPRTPREHFAFLEGTATVILASTREEGWAKIRATLSSFDSIISTRLDSDDCLAPKFISATRATADAELETRTESFVVSPQGGAIASLSEWKWRHVKKESPPFISFVHNLADRCVLHFGHTTHGGFPLMPVEDDGPLGCALLHEGNLYRQWTPKPQDKSLDIPPFKLGSIG